MTTVIPVTQALADCDLSAPALPGFSESCRKSQTAAAGACLTPAFQSRSTSLTLRNRPRRLAGWLIDFAAVPFLATETPETGCR
jgi:hypothetical protein